MEAPLESISVFVTSTLKKSLHEISLTNEIYILACTFSDWIYFLIYKRFPHVRNFFKSHPSITKRVTKTFIKIISLYAYNFFDGFCATTMGKTWDSVEQPRRVDTITGRELSLGENISLKIVEILVFSWDYCVKTLSLLQLIFDA